VETDRDAEDFLQNHPEAQIEYYLDM